MRQEAQVVDWLKEHELGLSFAHQPELRQQLDLAMTDEWRQKWKASRAAVRLNATVAICDAIEQSGS